MPPKLYLIRHGQGEHNINVHYIPVFSTQNLLTCSAECPSSSRSIIDYNGKAAMSPAQRGIPICQGYLRCTRISSPAYHPNCSLDIWPRAREAPITVCLSSQCPGDQWLSMRLWLEWSICQIKCPEADLWGCSWLRSKQSRYDTCWWIMEFEGQWWIAFNY